MSLLQFEKQFDDQLYCIVSTPWPSLRLIMLKSLHQTIVETLPDHHQPSYLIQIKPLIAGALRNVDQHPPIDPAILEWGYHQVEKDENDKIIGVIALSYFKLGAFEKLVAFLNYAFSVELKIDLPSDSSPRQKKYFIDNINDSIPQSVSDILKYHLKIDRYNSSHRTVNGLFIIQSGDFAAGVIAKVSCERAVASEKLALDQVRIATHLVDESDILSDQTQSVCQYLHTKFRYDDETHIRLEYTLNQPSSLLVGNSAGLALAVLGTLGLQMYKSNRTFQPRVYTDVALTGAIDNNGIVLAVDESTLRHKICAAFFAGMRTVIVPESQEDVAKAALTNLQQCYPNRSVEIVPVSTIDELEERRDIIHYQRRKITSRVSQFVKDYANSVTYSIMAFILILGAGFWFGIVKNPVPTSTEKVELNNTFKVKNKYGFVVWNSLENARQSIIYDINRNGLPEVLITYNNNAKHENKGKLVCYNSIGDVLWIVDAGEAVSYGNTIYSDYFSFEMLYVEDLDFDDIPEIYCYSSQGYFPNRFIVLNNKGELLSEYWNSGGLADVIAADIYTDNEYKELVISGRNNEDGAGILIVLDPFHTKGHSPQQKYNYTKNNTEKGNEIYYLKFPFTHFRKKGYRDQSSRLLVTEAGEIRVQLSNEKYNKGAVYYTFNNSMEILFTALDDNYYKTYNMVFPQDKNTLSLTNNTDIHFKSIEYWNGKEWVIETSMNQEYFNTFIIE